MFVMKKISLIVLIFVLSISSTFATMSWEEETKLKTQVEKIYTSFDKKLSKLDSKSHANKLTILIKKIETLQTKKLSEKNMFILNHLSTLLKTKKTELEKSTPTEDSSTGPKDTTQSNRYDSWVAWFWTMGWSQEEYDEALKNSIEIKLKEFDKLTPLQQQMKLNYSSPSYSKVWWFLWTVEEVSTAMKKQIEKVEKWPKKDSQNVWQNNDLVYKYIVNDTNIAISVYKDWWLTKLPQEVLNQIWFYRTFVSPIYWDSSWWWKNNTIDWQTYEQTLALFWYSISTDKDSLDYLILKYDETKNLVWPSLHYIENKWK